MSWTGSEKHRDEAKQGPRSKPNGRTNFRGGSDAAVFLVPAGTKVEVSPITSNAWRPFTTTQDHTFHRRESSNYGLSVFRIDDWKMRVLSKWAQRL